MGAHFSYYILADSREGQLKEGNSHKPLHLCKRFRAISVMGLYTNEQSMYFWIDRNNAEIDVIWKSFRRSLNRCDYDLIKR